MQNFLLSFLCYFAVSYFIHFAYFFKFVFLLLVYFMYRLFSLNNSFHSTTHSSKLLDDKLCLAF